MTDNGNTDNGKLIEQNAGVEDAQIHDGDSTKLDEQTESIAVEKEAEEENKRLMEEQEARLMQRTGGRLPEKATNKLLKRERKYFDSADYVIAGKNKAAAGGNTGKPAVAQLIKSRGTIEPFPKPQQPDESK